MSSSNKKLAEALKSISVYIERKKPKSLEEAKHMLALISVIAGESLAEAA